MKLLLSVMMFLQYFLMGSFMPVISFYLKDVMGFSGAQAGMVLGISAASSFTAPLVTGVLADKLVPSGLLYGICHLLSAAALAVLAGRDTFVSVLVIYLLFMLVFVSTESLANIITFHRLSETGRGGGGFSGIRVWGTAGWVCAAWAVSLMVSLGHVPLLGIGFDLSSVIPAAAVCGLVLGLYSLAVFGKVGRKAGEISADGAEAGAGGASPGNLRAAVNLLSRPDVAAFALAWLLFYICERFFYFGTPIFLSANGIPDSMLMPFMSMGQAAEILFMFLLSLLLRRLGTRRVMLAGALCCIMKFGSYAAAGAAPEAVKGFLLAAGTLFHGPSFALFGASGFIYLDSLCAARTRAGAHQLFSFISLGLAGFAGSNLAGIFIDSRFVLDGGPSLFRFWTAPLLISVLLALITAFGGRRAERPVSLP